MNVESEIARLEHIIRYEFTDQFLAAEAIQMCAKVMRIRIKESICDVNNNVDLALVGDSTLDSMLCRKWYKARNRQGKEYATFIGNLRIDTIQVLA